jgi:hypothetical protein
MGEERARAAKEAIVVVHGTFSGPSSDAPKWWQPNALDTFIPRLHNALERRGVEPRCWAHCDQATSVFHWTGNNHWVDRTRAAAGLVRYLSEMAQAGWACHLVGHSHGGNVIAEALHALRGRPEGKVVRSVITLGTPFLDTLSTVERRRRRRRIYSNVLFLIAMVGCVLPMIVQAVREGWSSPAIAIVQGELLIFAVILSVWLGKIVTRRMCRKRAPESEPIGGLAINSRYDEAWQVLHHVRETVNPLAVKEGLARYLAGRMTAFVRRRLDRDEILSPVPIGDHRSMLATSIYRVLSLVSFGSLFVPSIYTGFSAEAIMSGVMLSVASFIMFPVLIFLLTFGSWPLVIGYMRPFVVFVNFVLSFGILPSEILTYVVRGQSWTLVQRLALGLDGFRFEFPRVKMLPELAGAAQFTFERLPEAVERRALAARADWIQRNLGSATETLSKLVLSAADISVLLQQLERDQSLVHAAYYTDDDCIELIADWINRYGARSAAEPAAS